MNRKICLFIVIAIIFVSLLSIYTQGVKTASNSVIPRLETISVLGLFPREQKVTLGKIALLSVGLFGPKAILSGISLEIVIDGKPYPVIEPLPSAVGLGWKPQIKEVFFDKELNKTFVDLALVFVEPEGFRFEGKFPFANFSFIGTKVGVVKVSFDPTKTMVLTKGNEVFPVKLEGAKVYVE